MIGKRLDALSEEDRRILQYASVQGEDFLSTVLAEALPSDELALEEALERIQARHRLVYREEEEEMAGGDVAVRYRFAHALYRETLYGGLLPKRRIALHQRAGESLERHYSHQPSRVANALAVHFERARNYGKAIEYLEMAGGNARAISVHGQAVELYGHALDLVQRIPEPDQAAWRIRLHELRGDAWLTLGDPRQAEVDYRAALRQGEAARDLLACCRALIDLANVHMYTRQPEEIERAASRALELAESLGNRAMWSEAAGQLAASRQVVGRVAEAHELYEKALAVALPMRHVPALLQSLTYRGVAHFFRSEYAAAEAAEREALALATEARDPFYLGLSRTYLGFSLANQGRLSEALRSLHDAVDLALRNQSQTVVARARNGIGWIHRELGSLDTAAAFDEASRETARRTHATEAEANALINLLQGHLQAGRKEEAHGAMQRVDALFDRELWNRWRFHDIRHQAACAEYWMATGAHDRAVEYATRLLANSERYGVPKYRAIALRLLGEVRALSDSTGAEELLLRSVSVLEGAPAPLVEWKTHAALGRVLRSAGRPAAARAAFSRGAMVVRALAAEVDDAALLAAFGSNDAIRDVMAGSEG